MANAVRGGGARRGGRRGTRAPPARRGVLKKGWPLRVGQLALTVLVTWFIADRVGLGLEELSGLDPRAWTPAWLPLAASCLLLFAGYVASAALWGRIVVDLGGPALPPSDAVRLFMVANLGRYVPGKVWQIAGLAVMARRRGVPAATATSAAVLGQGIALVGAALVGLPAFVAGPEGTRALAPVAAVVGLALAVGLLPPVFGRVARLWFRLARQEVPPGLGSLHVVRWLVLYVLNWVLYAISFLVLATAFGLELPVVVAASAFAAAYVLGYLMIFAPAGIGVREGFLVALLGPWVGAPAAAALAVIARVWTTAVEVVPAAVFWMRHVATDAGPDDVPEQGGENAGE